MAEQNPACVIDCGTGYTKMGFAGNPQPQFVIPTAIATNDAGPGEAKTMGVRDLDFSIGNDAVANKRSHRLNYPVQHGVIDNWDNMERLWQHCIFKHMRCEPEDHYFLLTEPPMNSPENREYTAEVMFETFNVPGLYIAVQAVLALKAGYMYSLMASESKGVELDPSRNATGCVIDSGDGVTHVVPVYENTIIGSCIKHIPLAGKDVTKFIMSLLRDRGEKFPPEDSMTVAREIKERHCYTCKDIAKEFQKFDQKPQKYIRQYNGVALNKSKYSVDVGYERFLGPELFFNPEIFSSDYPDPLSKVVDECILSCPIDCRRALYKNIVLSGGSTMFKDFNRRLERDIKNRTEARIDVNMAKLGSSKTRTRPKIDVEVVSHNAQRYAVWLGGSVLATQPNFFTAAHTKAEYDERGPSICRFNAAM